MKASRYVTTTLAAIALLAGLLGLFNGLVNPYLIFDTPRIDGFSDRKPAGSTHERIMKLHDAPRRPAKTLVLGSSRTGIGFNSQSSAWPASTQPVYNLSLAGSGPVDLLAYLQHVEEAQPPDASAPQTVLIGLDFESFLGSKTRSVDEVIAPGLSEVVSGSDLSPANLYQYLKEVGPLVLSLDAIAASAKAIVASRRHSGVNLDEHGWLDEQVFFEMASDNGVAVLFAQKNLETIRQYGSSQRNLSPTDGSEYRALDALIRKVHMLNARIVVFTQPVHAHRWEIFRALGYWRHLEAWKQELLEIVGKARAQGVDIVLWDFANYSPQMLESPPPMDARDAILEWFWEPSHYSTALGNLMIEQMMSNSAIGPGRRLTKANFVSVIDSIESDAARYQSAQQAEITALKTLLCTELEQRSLETCG